MTYDFAFFLLMGTLITGVIWALDAWVWAPKRKDNPFEYSVEGAMPSRRKGEPVVVEYAKSFFPVLLIVFLLRGFLVEPFRIPSGSMIPSLYIGDFILVNKFSYGIRLPVANVKIVEIDNPERGDVVVFRYPRDPSIDYIKRVIGLPGDHIAYYNKVLYINGKPVKREYVSIYNGPGEENTAKEYLEKLDDRNHIMLLIPGRPSLDAEYIVPEGHYFMMGDNRDNSNDSRYWGVVPDKYLVGKAFMIWMNWSSGVDWKRIGTFIK
ncbi:MAG: signal peptidase I [Gammaproteobacteria bacterium]|nr:signal peptidase I [Gammaproteobacteria bacterium]MCW8909064.1 signal peptidase I [Gammaproteobacteria bacterium]MCW9004553.1 signal peptidase I [Gammaproteobacteria bacterium]MCW9055962.1 signal peptidase I [Gammaproteobacteria bacterium]